MRWLVPAGFALTTFVLRVATRATFPTEWDSAQLALGVHDFDVRVDQPHPPGYWLYVGLGRVVWSLTPLSAHTSLVAVSAAGAAAGVVVAYVLGRRLGGTWLAVAFAAVVATNPLLWFYGSIAATYVFDAIAGGLVLLLAASRAEDDPPPRWERVAIPFAVALQGGFRPSLLVFFAPVVAVLLVVRCGRDVRRVAEGALAGAAGVLVWLVPMALDQPGGLAVLREQNTRIWRDAAHFTSPLFGASSRLVETNVLRTAGWTAAAVAPAVAAAVVAAVVARRRPGAPRRLWATTAAVVGVQLLSGLLLHFGKAGYVAGYLPASLLALLLVAGAAARLRTILVGAVVAVQAATFLFAEGMLPRSIVGEAHEAPYRATRRAVEAMDVTVARHLSLGEDFPADRTVFVFPGGPGDNLYRQLGYLSPELDLHFLADGYDWARSRGRVQSFERDRVVEVPPGRDVVVVTTAPSDELRALVRAGAAEPVELRSGAVVWVVARGTLLHQVRLG